MHCVARFSVAFALIAFTASSARAGDSAYDFGPYLGLGATYASPLFKDELESLIPGSKIDESWGLTAQAGLRLLPFLAIEAE